MVEHDGEWMAETRRHERERPLAAALTPTTWRIMMVALIVILLLLLLAEA